MYNSGMTYKNPGFQGNAYVIREIMEATPEKLIIKIYDFAIVNCQKHDMVKTNNALAELIRALNFKDEKAKDISISLMQLYQFCQEQMRKKNYEMVYKILTELRETWQTIFERKNNSKLAG